MPPRLCLAFALAAMGCGRGGERMVVAPAPAVHGPLASVDEEHTLSPITIEVEPPSPAALVRPPLPEIDVGGTSLAAARRALGTRPSAAQVRVFATLAWREADALRATDATAANTLLVEARGVARRFCDVAGRRIDLATLEVAAGAELLAGDLSQAVARFAELVARFPSAAQAPTFVAWQAYLELQLGHLAAATALVDRWNLAAAVPIQIYVAAWVAFAGGDLDATRRAVAAIAHALSTPPVFAQVASWPSTAERGALDRELIELIARSDSELEVATAVLSELARGQPASLGARLIELSEAYYRRGGDYQRASAALELALGQAPAERRSQDLVAIRFRQADYLFRLDQPVAAATAALTAERGLAACGEPCDAETAAITVRRIARMAQFSHSVFATSQDPDHLAAALMLYRAYLALPPHPEQAELAELLGRLEQTRSNRQGGGRHGSKLMQDFTLLRREALAGCYAAALVGQPAIDRSFRLTIDVAADGHTTRVTGEPAAATPMLGCLVDRIGRWRYPRRTTPGNTRIHVQVGFRPATDAATRPAR